MDYTTAFDKRLEALQKGSGRRSVAEVEATINVYENLKTAVSMCTSIDIDCSDTLVVAVFAELCASISVTQKEQP